MCHRTDPSSQDALRYYDQWLDSLFIFILILLAVLVVLISIFVNLKV
jgi:hypothetical protein